MMKRIETKKAHTDATDNAYLQNEDTKKSTSKKRFINEAKLFYQFLKQKPCTCSEVAEALKIKQKNLTRYKRQLQKKQQLAVLNSVRCPITGFMAQLISTDEKLFINLPKQLQIEYEY